LSQTNDAQVEPFRHANFFPFSLSILSKSLSIKGESLFLPHHPSLFSKLRIARDDPDLAGARVIMESVTAMGRYFR
jgi:hypothetical protein